MFAALGSLESISIQARSYLADGRARRGEAAGDSRRVTAVLT
jgi:hypothetical protein